MYVIYGTYMCCIYALHICGIYVGIYVDIYDDIYVTYMYVPYVSIQSMGLSHTVWPQFTIVPDDRQQSSNTDSWVSSHESANSRKLAVH